MGSNTGGFDVIGVIELFSMATIHWSLQRETAQKAELVCILKENFALFSYQ